MSASRKGREGRKGLKGRRSRLGLLLLRAGGFSLKEAAALMRIGQKNADHHWREIKRRAKRSELWQLAERVQRGDYSAALGRPLRAAFLIAVIVGFGCAQTPNTKHQTPRLEARRSSASAEAMADLATSTTPARSATLTWTNPADDFWHVATIPENYAVRQLNWQTGVVMSQDLCAWSEIWVSGYTDSVSVTVPVVSQVEFYKAFNRWRQP